MFTGIIEAIGTVRSTRSAAGGIVLAVDLGSPWADLKLGDSVAVNGVCLTVSAINGQIVDFDVSGETLEKSTTGALKPGWRVNLEPAMAANGRFGGHIVQGHVDGVAKVKKISKNGDFAEISFAADTALLDAMVTKGSVAVDGISLTVASVDSDSFTVALIPTTLAHTTLASAKVSDAVNIETDIITKTVRSYLARMIPSEGRLSAERLRELGF